MKTGQKKKLWMGFVATVSSFALLLLFQNCSGYDSGGGSEGSNLPQTTPGQPVPSPVPNAPTPTPAPVCPVNANANPSGSVAQSTVGFQIGMGRDAGTQANTNVQVSVSSGDANSAVTAVNCQVPNGSPITVNCNLNGPTRNGNFNANIQPAQNVECPAPQAVTVTVRATDSVVNAQNVPIAACGALTRNNVTVATFTVNVGNGCLPTQRVGPDVPYMTAQMGTAVAIDGTRAVTVAPGDDAAVNNGGAAFVMNRSGATWSRSQKLVPSNIVAGAQIQSVAINGDLIALGAAGSNRVYVYRLINGTWTQIQTLQPPASAGTAAPRFGASVAISNGNIAVGAPRAIEAGGLNSGAVYVFSGANFNALTTLRPSGAPLVDGEFGLSLAYSGNRLAVGAPFPNGEPDRLEAVYIFDSNTLSQKLTAPANARWWFGYSVALQGNNLLVGQPFFNNEQGRAQLYVASNGTFNNATRTYVAADATNPNEDKDRFGKSVALGGNSVLIGAPDKPEAQTKIGAVYLYGTGANNQLFKVRPRANDRGQFSFGHAVGVSGDGWLISGSLNYADNDVPASGSVFFMDLP